MNETASADGAHDDIVYPSALPFVLAHAACFAALWSGITWQAIAIGVTLYWLRIFAIGAGYHRYFSHRSFATSRAFQFVLAVLSQSTAQKSVLWWAAKHRHHHAHSDTEHDVHSPRHKGFLYSHLGWIFARQHASADLTKVADLAHYPELMWLHKYELVPPVGLAILCFVAAGWPGLIVGFFWSTVLVYHATFCINSLAHVRGSKRYVTGDDSRNNWLLALFTMGEGWHNNHHAYQSSARQGFRAREFDPTFYILRALSWAGLVWDIKLPPDRVLRNEHRLGSKVITKAAVQLAARFDAEGIARTLAASLQRQQLSEFRQTVIRARDGLSKAFADFHLPQVPTREEFTEEARAWFASSPSIEKVADHAYELLLSGIASYIVASDEIGEAAAVARATPATSRVN